MKKYINSNGDFWNGKSIVLGEMRVFNPTEEQLTEAGYHEYILPATEVEETNPIDEAKRTKIQEIGLYDNSPAVNSFTINGQPMWLSVEERQQIATQVNVNEAAGRDTMVRWFNGNPFEFSIAQWKQMLAAVELYAGDALNVTEQHKAAVNAMSTIEEIESYDYTVGYPEKLQF